MSSPTIEMAGEMYERQRNLNKSLERAKEREENIKKFDLFIDKYTNIEWFEKEGYL